jgi:hypothetical protein
MNPFLIEDHLEDKLIIDQSEYIELSKKFPEIIQLDYYNLSNDYGSWDYLFIPIEENYLISPIKKYLNNHPRFFIYQFSLDIMNKEDLKKYRKDFMKDLKKFLEFSGISNLNILEYRYKDILSGEKRNEKFLEIRSKYSQREDLYNYIRSYMEINEIPIRKEIDD